MAPACLANMPPTCVGPSQPPCRQGGGRRERRREAPRSMIIGRHGMVFPPGRAATRPCAGACGEGGGSLGGAGPLHSTPHLNAASGWKCRISCMTSSAPPPPVLTPWHGVLLPLALARVGSSLLLVARIPSGHHCHAKDNNALRLFFADPGSEA